MPELPEVQAHAERLTERLTGAELQRFEPLSFTALKTFDPPADAAVGSVLTGVGRRGKHLIMGFGDLSAVVHLMQGGRLRFDEKLSAKPRDGIARWRFADGRALLLTEAGTEKRAGVWMVRDDPVSQPPLDHLGPEADTIDADQMSQLFKAHSMRIHTFLRDQRILAGIGRRLANEVCHRAKLSPFAQTSKFGDDEAKAVVEAIRAAVDDGLAYERTRDDMSSSKERPGRVHGRAGEACEVCGDVIRAVEYNAYTVSYCATCQTGGKVLADNTTSKFLK